MFRRLIIEQWTVIFTLVAFSTALTIYLMFFWRALRMKRSQTEHLSRLPFVDETPSRRHE
jgi:uncharacterized membrane protein